MDTIIEFFKFLVNRKKYWLIPLMVIMFMFASLIFITQGTVVAPLIYTIF